MKYLDLILKLIIWNFVCILGFCIAASFFVGEPIIIAFGAFTIGPVVGTIVGIVKYQKNQKGEKSFR